MKHFLAKISWGSMLFLGLTPFIGFGGLAFLIAHHALKWPTVAFTLIIAVATGFGVTAGYHRLFAHKSYEAKRACENFCCCFSAPLHSRTRRCAGYNHHKFVDTEQDPYNVRQGFWHAHVGWILFKRTVELKSDNVADLEKDRLVMLQERWFPILSVLSGFAFPMAVASLWGDALGGLLLGGFLRIVLNHHFTLLDQLDLPLLGVSTVLGAQLRARQFHSRAVHIRRGVPQLSSYVSIGLPQRNQSLSLGPDQVADRRVGMEWPGVRSAAHLH